MSNSANTSTSSSRNFKGSSRNKNHSKSSEHHAVDIPQNVPVQFNQYHQYPHYPQHPQHPPNVSYPIGGFGQASVMPPHIYSGRGFSNSNHTPHHMNGYGQSNAHMPPHPHPHMYSSSNYDRTGNNSIPSHENITVNPTRTNENGHTDRNKCAYKEFELADTASQSDKPTQFKPHTIKPRKDEHSEHSQQSQQSQPHHNVEPKNIFTKKAAASDEANISFQNDHSAPKNDKHEMRDKDVSSLVDALNGIPYNINKNEVINKLMASLVSRNKQGTKFYNNIIADLIKQLTDNHIAMKEFYINTPEKHMMLQEIMGIFYHKGYFCQLSMRPGSNDKSFYAMVTITPN